MHGFYRVAVGVPRVTVAETAANTAQLIALMQEAEKHQAALVVFPELCVTGYTCGDLFHQTVLLDAAVAALAQLREASRAGRQIVIVGLPLLHRNRLYNCAVVIQAGVIRGVVPKSYLPNYKEYYEKRWFTSGREVRGEELAVAGERVPFGTDLLFVGNDEFVLGVELCEDLWNVIPPSCHQALAGATVLANLSASDELVAKAEYRRGLVLNQSARCVAAYCYTSCGVTESTQDVVFGGHALIAENGVLVAENERFHRQSELTFAEVDCQRLQLARLLETSFADNPAPPFRRVPLAPLPTPQTLERWVDPHPFVPKNPAVRDARCREIFSIQASGLAKRLEYLGRTRAVIGVSGGLDSTLALLVTREAMKLIGAAPDRIIAVTMPGFGTTGRTYENAVRLCRSLGAEFREIPIRDACRQHFQDIGHPMDAHDTTFENVQARERTQILMDLANQEGGIVVGTGDLSEIALGWATYSGDHISMYAVNCSVPKTLIRYLIAWVAEHAEETIRWTLNDILETPISPELLPANDRGEIQQKTEEVIGPYELHDFFLYHTVKYGAPPAKLKFLAQHAFSGKYDEASIAHWLTLFLSRFFAQQYKRSCIPDGPKVGTISLSPRGDWRMPPDAAPRVWLDAADAAE